eukprot:m.352050 g.352050  ORF g.352050 m.352050 type:complete len:410 (-) comp16427_c0_seq1:115-1344(-)
MSGWLGACVKCVDCCAIDAKLSAKLSGVLGNTRHLGDEVIDRSVSNGRGHNVKAHGIVALEGVGSGVPGLAAIGALDEPRVWSNSVELATNSPDGVVIGEADVNKRVVDDVGAWHGKGLVEVGTVHGAVDVGTGHWTVRSLSDSAAVVWVGWAAVNAIKVNSVVHGEKAAPGLTTISGLDNLTGVTVSGGCWWWGSHDTASGVHEAGALEDAAGVAAWELTGGNKPLGVGWVSGVTGVCVKDRGSDWLEELAAISGDSNTLLSTVSTGSTKLLATITVLTKEANGLGEATTDRLVEGSTVIVGVELAKDGTNNNVLVNSSSREEKHINTKVGLAVSPVLATVSGLEDFWANTVSSSDKESLISGGECNTNSTGEKVLGDKLPIGSNTAGKGSHKHKGKALHDGVDGRVS